MLYQRCFGLHIFHSYYPDQVCSDFIIQPTQACRKLIRNYRLILKNTVNGLWVLMPVNAEQQPVFPFTDSLTLTFLLKLNNPELISFTQLEDSYSAIASLYTFTNQEIETPGKADLTAVLVQRSGQSSEPDLNRSQLEQQLAEIPELKTAERKGVFGIITIHNNASLPEVLTQPSEFQITFSAKTQPWKYYLVTAKNTQPTVFSIQDKDAEITFTPTEIHSSDRIVAAIQHRFPESQSYLFQSTTQVLCQEIGRQNIQLLKQGQTKPWIPHLPIPPNQHGIQVINVLEDL